MSKMLERLRRDEDGSTLVEFAMVSTVFLLLMFALADIGLVEIGNSVGSNAARDGARTAIVNSTYVNAQTAGTANNTKIVNAVTQRLSGLVRGTPTVAVQCLDDHTTPGTLTPETCTSANVETGTDLIEVAVTWKHISATPFVPNNTHTQTARMVITG
jgi:Flp pilus assembly protein TadG